MKRSAFFFLLIFVFAVNSFSQVKTPIEVINEFWSLALKNDFEAAKKQINLTFFGKTKLENLKQVFQSVAQNELKITKFEKEEVLPLSAEIVFRAKGKNRQEILVRIRLIKPLGAWQVMSLETFAQVLVESDTVFIQPLPIPNFESKKEDSPQIVPLQPYDEKKNPATFLVEPYNEKKNLAAYQFIPKKP